MDWALRTHFIHTEKSALISLRNYSKLRKILQLVRLWIQHINRWLSGFCKIKRSLALRTLVKSRAQTHTMPTYLRWILLCLQLPSNYIVTCFACLCVELVTADWTHICYANTVLQVAAELQVFISRPQILLGVLINRHCNFSRACNFSVKTFIFKKC